jgi:tetratricopeptide (TPR) repeat protein
MGDKPMADAPKVFISYASEDQAHSDWVRELASRFRADGFDVSLDRWGARPGDELRHFSGQSRRDDCFLFLVCTPSYKIELDRRLESVDYEARNAKSEIRAGLDAGSLIVIHRSGSWQEAAPAVVRGEPYVDLTEAVLRETAYRDLVDVLHARNWVTKPIARQHVSFEGPGTAPARPVPHFTDRDAELEMLTALLTAGDPNLAVVISGDSGAGKTALARQLLVTRAPALFPDGALWVDGQHLTEDLARLARRLGWTNEADPTPQQAAAFLRKELQRLAALLIIDDLAGEADVPSVPVPGAKCRTLVISRATSVNEQWKTLRLERWPRGVSRSYLRRAVPRLDNEPDTEVDALTGFVQGLPLALSLMAAALTARPQLSTRNYLERLKTEPVGALRAFAKEGDRGLVATFLEAQRSLAPEDQKALEALAACRQGTREEVVAAVAGLEASSSTVHLNRLAKLSLVENREGADAPWALHDVVRTFVRAGPGAQDADAAHFAWVRDRLGRGADLPPSDADEKDIAEAVTALERQLDTGEGAWVGHLFHLLYRHLTFRGRYPLVVALGERLLALDGSLPTLESQAAILGNLGMCYGRLGNMPKAIELLERALQINETLGRLDSQAIQLGNLGNCYLTLGDLANAVEFLLLSLALHEQLERVEDQALLLGNLGIAFRKMGNVPRSIGFHHRALTMHEKLDRPDGQAAQLGYLGLCHRELNDLRRAIAFHERALSIYEKLGRVDGQAVQLGHMISCFESLGETPAVIHLLERGLAIFEAAGLAETHPTVLNFQRMLSAAQRS